MKQDNEHIPEGYRDSPLGVIPEGWEVERLGEICPVFKSGYSITSQKIFEQEEYPVYGGNGLRGYTNTYTHNGKYILIGRQGALCGNINFVDGEIYISEHAIAVQPNEKNNIKFLMYKLDFWKLNRYSESSAQPGLSVEKLIKYRIALPPLPEQKKIAEILNTWDEAIELQSKLVDSLTRRKRGLMQQLLKGKQRLSGFSEKWKEVRIEDIGKVITGNTPSMQKSEYYGDYICWATAVDFNGIYIYDTKIKLSLKGKKQARFAPKGSILVTCIASIGKNAIAGIELAFNQQINAIIPNNNFDSEFIYYQIDNSKHILETYAGAGAVQIINKETFRKIKIKIPSFIEQKAVANILTTADLNIKLAKKNLVQIQLQKRGLMQQLLTGKRRVKL